MQGPARHFLEAEKSGKLVGWRSEVASAFSVQAQGGPATEFTEFSFCDFDKAWKLQWWQGQRECTDSRRKKAVLNINFTWNKKK